MSSAAVVIGALRVKTKAPETNIAKIANSEDLVDLHSLNFQYDTTWI